jgi:hypothetical protein
MRTPLCGAVNVGWRSGGFMAVMASAWRIVLPAAKGAVRFRTLLWRKDGCGCQDCYRVSHRRFISFDPAAR